MSRPSLRDLTEQLAQSDPENREEQARIHGQLREMVEVVRRRDVPDLTACLQACEHLCSVLASESERFRRDRLRRTVCILLEEARTAFARPTSPAPEPESSPAPEPLPEVVPDPPAPSSNEEPAAEKPKSPRLGEMLIERGHATESQVEDALKMNQEQGLPIGECLLLLGACSPEHVLETLKVQASIRMGENAVAAGKEAPGPMPARPPVEYWPRDNAAFQITGETFLGEVLLGMEMITNEQLEQAMHLHHHKGVRIGQALTELGAISSEELERGLALHESLRKIALTRKMAT